MTRPRTVDHLLALEDAAQQQSDNDQDNRNLYQRKADLFSDGSTIGFYSFGSCYWMHGTPLLP